MTLAEKYPDVIKHLVSCNGTGRIEVQRLIDSGKLTPYEGYILYSYACLEQANQKLDALAAKVEDL